MGEDKPVKAIRVRRKASNPGSFAGIEKHYDLAIGEMMAVLSKIEEANGTGDWRKRKQLLNDCVTLVDSVIGLIKDARGGA